MNTECLNHIIIQVQHSHVSFNVSEESWQTEIQCPAHKMANWPPHSWTLRQLHSVLFQNSQLYKYEISFQTIKIKEQKNAWRKAKTSHFSKTSGANSPSHAQRQAVRRGHSVNTDADKCNYFFHTVLLNNCWNNTVIVVRKSVSYTTPTDDQQKKLTHNRSI